jgi:hypothetical protein
MRECHYYNPSSREVKAKLVAEILIGKSDGVYVVRSKGKFVSCRSSIQDALAWIGRNAGLHHSIEYVPRQNVSQYGQDMISAII